MSALRRALAVWLLFGCGGIAAEQETIKLSPSFRAQDLEQATTRIASSPLQAFMINLEEFDEEEFKLLPYVATAKHHQVSLTEGELMLVRGQVDSSQPNYNIFTEGKQYLHPETEEPLGYLAQHVGVARLEELAEHATFMVLRSHREINIGNRLKVTANLTQPQTYQAKAAATEKIGVVLDIVGNVNIGGRNQVVVLSLGKREGLNEGELLASYQPPREKEDLIAEEVLKTPGVKTGTLLVYKVFNKMSLALVLNAASPIETNFKVASPKIARLD